MVPDEVTKDPCACEEVYNTISPRLEGMVQINGGSVNNLEWSMKFTTICSFT